MAPLRLVVGDDGTNPAWGAVEARRLVRGGCRVVLVGTTSATSPVSRTRCAADGVLLVHALMNEGGLGGELCIRWASGPTCSCAPRPGP